MKKQVTWEEVYKLPLVYDGYNYAWSNNDNMALMFEFGLSNEDCQRIVNILNDKAEGNIENLTHDAHEFFADGQYIFCVRGWGFLTGIGGLNLSQEKAAELQDGFINFIYEKLK